MDYKPQNYEEYVRLYQELSRTHEAEYTSCQEMCNDVWRDSNIKDALTPMAHFCKKLKAQAEIPKEKFQEEEKEYIWKTAKELPGGLNKFKRLARLVRKEHKEKAPEESREMIQTLKMFSAMNKRCETEWLPALAKELKNKKWEGAAMLVAETPFYPVLGGNNYPDYCVLRLQKLCEKIPGNEKLLKEYERLHEQGLKCYHAIPRRIMLAAGVRRQEKIIAQQKPAAFAAVEEYLARLKKEEHPSDWVKGLTSGLAQAAKPYTEKAQSALRNKNFLAQEISRKERE